MNKTKPILLTLLAAASLPVLSTPALAAGKEEVVTVFKVAGQPWFNRVDEGVKMAAKNLNVEAYGIGATTTDEAAQVSLIEDSISKGVQALCVIPNDAKSVEPSFQKAHDKGIFVITHESPNQQGEDYNIEAIDNIAFARYLTDELAGKMGGSGEYALMVGSLTAPTHNLWADESIRYAKEKYPNLKLVTDRVTGGDDLQEARKKMLDLITAYPNLKGFLGYGSQGPIGASLAVKERHVKGKIVIVGSVLPSQAAPHLKDGTMYAGALWDPKTVGFGMTYVAKCLIEGKKIEDGMEIPNVGKITVQGKNILLNSMLKISAQNASSLGF